MEWLLSWEVSSVVVGLFITVALAVLALNDFKIAKVCFAAAAAYAAASVLKWEAHNELSGSEQIAIGVLVLFFIFLLLIIAFRYTDRKERAREQEKQLFSQEFAKQITGELKKATLGTGTDEGSQVIEPGDGFVQFENRSVVIENQAELQRIASGDLRIGEIVKVKFTSANRGPRPVFDYQSWGSVVCVDPAKNPGKHLRDVMLRGLEVGYDRFKKSGNDLGAGKESFNFAQSTPLTAEELEGLKSGALRVHILLGGAWSNSKGARLYWTNAEWTNWPQVPIEASFWKGA